MAIRRSPQAHAPAQAHRYPTLAPSAHRRLARLRAGGRSSRLKISSEIGRNRCPQNSRSARIVSKNPLTPPTRSAPDPDCASRSGGQADDRVRTISHPPTSDAAYSGGRPTVIRNIRSIRGPNGCVRRRGCGSAAPGFPPGIGAIRGPLIPQHPIKNQRRHDRRVALNNKLRRRARELPPRDLLIRHRA